jgi:hypothetical protein
MKGNKFLFVMGEPGRHSMESLYACDMAGLVQKWRKKFRS